MADKLQEALSDLGIAAEAFHHKRPHEYASAWESALFYAQERANITSAFPCDDAPRVLVCDRWTLSTRVEALSAADHRSCAPYLSLADAEDQALPRAQYIILDAPPNVLAERIAARGEPIDPHADKIRAHYLATARDDEWPVVDTSQPRDTVLAQLVAIVQGWL